MANGSDTLNIGSIRLRNEFPMAQAETSRPTDSVIHAEAAAAARARIAAASDYHPLADSSIVPATPTADLVIDKKALAQTGYHKPLVRYKLPSVALPAITAIGIFLLVLLLFKAPVIISQVQYAFSDKQPQSATIVPPAATEVIPAENTITIDKINVKAPVVYQPSIKEDDVQKALEAGTAHYGNTAFPGQVGNVAIFGHSSNDWWEPGNYKFVFVLLDKLSPGDRISIDYQSKRYIYEVTGNKIVEPTNVGVLNPTAEPTLTLITCTPPGTSLKRLVVTAKQVSPSPTTNATAQATPTPATQTPSTLTSSESPSFLKQLENGWKGIFSGFTSLVGGSPKLDSETSPEQLPAIK